MQKQFLSAISLFLCVALAPPPADAATCPQEEQKVGLENFFRKTLDRNKGIVDGFFSDEEYIQDNDIYRFPSADNAYGKILVSKRHYEEYLVGTPLDGLKIIKITFNISDDCDPVLSDIFFYARDGEDSHKFYEYKNGKISLETRCASCHENLTDKLFYKWEFEGKID